MGGRPGMGGPPGMRGGMNLTEGPIFNTLFMFSLPMLGSNVLQSLNGFVNQFWVAHILGDHALAALGNANLIMMLMLGAIFGVSMSANILVAQAVGSGNLPLVKKVMGTSMTFFFALSGLLALAGLWLTPHILAAVGTPVDARADATIYLRIIFLSMPFQYFFAFLQMAQRGAGDSKTPLYFQVLAVALSVIFNPLMIRGDGPLPTLGIAGSAASNLLGQGVALLALFIYLYRSHSILLLRPNEFRLLKPSWDILQSLLTRGIPMGLQMFIMSGTAMVMVTFVNKQGTTVTAAYFAASQIWTYLQMPTMAIGGSISSMAGQNIGANKWDRVEKVALTGMAMGFAVTAALAAVIYLLNNQILHVLLRAGSPAIPVAEHINQVVLWGFVAFSVTFALSGVVRATGAVWVPLIILTFSMVAIRIPFAALLQPYMGQEAIWWSFPLGTIASAALSLAYYKWGPWRQMTLLGDMKPGGMAADTGQAAPAMDVPEEDEEVEELLEAGLVSNTEPAVAPVRG
ncbi:MAG: MATE family efflux transporter [Caulobacteraceae bacterium]